MARTASMTIAEAEAAIGRRGDVTVTSENRGLVRKWFVAQGLPALFVGGLSMRELALAYNDTKGDQFARLLKKYEEAKEAAGDEVPDQVVEANQTFETASNGTNGHANSDATALLELLRKTIGSSVDANQVREIVDATIKEKADSIAAELKDLISPVTRVQLIAPSGETKDVEGPLHPNFPLLLKMAQVREALERQAATSEVLRVISSSPSELESVFQAILANATRICEAKFGNLWLREGDNARIAATHGAPSGYREYLKSEPVAVPAPGSRSSTRPREAVAPRGLDEQPARVLPALVMPPRLPYRYCAGRERGACAVYGVP